MHLEIIKPDAELYSGDVVSVQVPGANGLFEILNDHMPIVSNLTAGKVRVIDTNNQTEYFEITGGVIEMNNNKITVLAD